MIKKVLLIMVSFILTAILTGCGGTDQGGEETVYKDRGRLPALMAVSDDNYYMLTCMYGDDDYRFSVSRKAKKLNLIYEAEGTSIWYLYSEGSNAAWAEKYADRYEYKVYDSQAGEVKSIDSVKAGDSEPQNMQMGMHKGKVYYSKIDHTDNKVCIKSYDIKEKNTENIYESVMEEAPSTALEVKGGVLTAYLGKGELYSLDLESDEETTVEIPGSINTVYAVSYDRENELYALYYSEEGSGTEAIGTFAPGDGQVRSVYTLGGNSYAYRDRIAIDKGHLFWITQQNISGNVADHYTLSDYSCQEDKVEEYPGAFAFALTDSKLYALLYADSISRICLEETER